MKKPLIIKAVSWFHISVSWLYLTPFSVANWWYIIHLVLPMVVAMKTCISMFEHDMMDMSSSSES